MNWDQLPDILTTEHLQEILLVKNRKTVSSLCRSGQLPAPVITTGNIRRWRKEDVRATLERRSQMVR